MDELARQSEVPVSAPQGKNTNRFERDLLLPRLIAGKLPVEALPIAFPPSMAERKPA